MKGYSKNKFPSWYDGIDENDVKEWNDRYKGGRTVFNRYSGKSVELTAEETAVYDMLLGVIYVGDHEGWTDQEIDLRKKAKSWFKKVNPEAYKILIKEL